VIRSGDTVTVWQDDANCSVCGAPIEWLRLSVVDVVDGSASGGCLHCGAEFDVEHEYAPQHCENV